MWPNLLLHKETSLGPFVLVFAAAGENHSWLFPFPLLFTKGTNKKAKIFCFQNERKSFVETRSGQQLGLCFVQQELLMQGRASGRALQGGGRGAAWGEAG